MLAEAAAYTANESEAEAMAGAAFATIISPSDRRALRRILRHMVRGTAVLTRILRRHRRTRPAVRAVPLAACRFRSLTARRMIAGTLPGIARRTVEHIARQVATGRRITPHTAVRTLAHQAKRVLGTPRHRVHALRRHNLLERRLHGRLGRGIAQPLHGGRHYLRGRVPGRAGYGVARGHGAVPGHAAARGVAAGGHASRAGRMVGGQCRCAQCPSCGGPAAGAAPA